ncbi:MAG: sce7726 family protein [Bacteroidales bacterium]|nr:sce7726 family protein [Bacteroidales bacterium]
MVIFVNTTNKELITTFTDSNKINSNSMKQSTNSVETLREWARIFSPPTFRKIVEENDSSFFVERIEAGLKNTSKKQANLALIKSFYKELAKNYRCEYIYKNTVFNTILKKYGLLATLTLNEFKVGKSIADLVLLNGTAKVYEIKTELDSLDKLDKQIEDYMKFADMVQIVADEVHIAQLQEAYDSSTIGIIELNSKNKLITIKEAQTSAQFFDFNTLFKVLRKQEYLDLTLHNFDYIPDVPNTRIYRCCYELLSTVGIEKFQKQVVAKLKERSIQNPKKLMSRETPKELKYICNSLDLNDEEYDVLYNFLKTDYLCTNPM